MLQLSVENHSSKTATCGLDPIFKVLVKFKYSYQEFNLISQPLKGNGNEGWGDGKWNTGLPTLASFQILSLTCSAGFTDGGAGPVPGTGLHSPAAVQEPRAWGSHPAPLWDCWSWGSILLPHHFDWSAAVKINLAVFSFFWESQSWNNVQIEPTTQAKTASLLGSDWRFSPLGTLPFPSPSPGLCSSPSGPLEVKCPHPSCQCLPQILHR